MINIIDTYSNINSIFDGETFCIEKWERYINDIYKDSAPLFFDDMNDCLKSGEYTYENDILPIINSVCLHSELEELHSSFHKVTDGLNKRVIDRFRQELNIDIVLYVGLCNAAGWVTTIHGRDVILLGIEKILELNWQDEDSMRGLIYHELGHAYHKQHGAFDRQIYDNSQHFVWQLFTEGIAMYFEQALVDDYHYYHQNNNGWLEWCDIHFQQILIDFNSDLPTMTRTNQRYFGDWVSYYGKSDVGYYLGTKFVQQLCKNYSFELIINMSPEKIYQEYLSFVKTTE